MVNIVLSMNLKCMYDYFNQMLELNHCVKMTKCIIECIHLYSQLEIVHLISSVQCPDQDCP